MSMLRGPVVGRRDLHTVLTPACATRALSGGEFLSQSGLWDSTHPALPGPSPPSLCSPGPEPSKPGLTVKGPPCERNSHPFVPCVPGSHHYTDSCRRPNIRTFPQSHLGPRGRQRAQVASVPQNLALNPFPLNGVPASCLIPP